MGLLKYLKFRLAQKENNTLNVKIPLQNYFTSSLRSSYGKCGTSNFMFLGSVLLKDQC